MKKILPFLLIMTLFLTSCEKLPEADKKSDKMLSKMSLDEKIWQMFIVAPEDIIAADAVKLPGELTKKSIQNSPVGGFIFFDKNIDDKEQISHLISGMQDFSKIPLFIAVDEEGGRVSRLGNKNIGVTHFPPMAQIGETDDEAQAANVGAVLGRELTAIGFNLDFAPVADVITVVENESIGDRSFGSDPYLAAKMVAAQVGAMQGEDLCATLKHFPGNGSIREDTHNEAGVCQKSLEELRETEFVPFKAGIDAGADFVMVAHMSVSEICGDTPASLSKEVMDILRTELGFSGIVITDALNMGAVTNRYTPAKAAVMAINAGADILLMPPDAQNTVAAIRSAVESGEITEERIDESVRRIIELKIKRGIIE